MEMHAVRLRSILLEIRSKYAELLSSEVDDCEPFMIALYQSIHELEIACHSLESGVAPSICCKSDVGVWHIDIEESVSAHEPLCGAEIEFDEWTETQFRVPTCPKCIAAVSPDDNSEEQE